MQKICNSIRVWGIIYIDSEKLAREIKHYILGKEKGGIKCKAQKERTLDFPQKRYYYISVNCSFKFLPLKPSTA